MVPSLPQHTEAYVIQALNATPQGLPRMIQLEDVQRHNIMCPLGIWNISISHLCYVNPECALPCTYETQEQKPAPSPQLIVGTKYYWGFEKGQYNSEQVIPFKFTPKSFIILSTLLFHRKKMNNNSLAFQLKIR